MVYKLMKKHAEEKSDPVTQLFTNVLKRKYMIIDSYAVECVKC